MNTYIYLSLFAKQNTFFALTLLQSRIIKPIFFVDFLEIIIFKYTFASKYASLNKRFG